MAHQIASLLTILAYLAAIAVLLKALPDAAPARGRNQAGALVIAVAALAFQGWALAGSLFQGNGLTLGFGSSLSLFAWQCSLLLVVLSPLRPLINLGLVIFPFAIICVAFDWAMPTDPDAVRGLSGAIGVHIVLSLLAYGLLTIAAAQAILLAVQDRALRRHRPIALLQSLPPLQTMETQLFELMAGGLFLLTMALAAGLIFVHNLFAQHLAHKTILSGIAWLVFAILLWGRVRFGWRGRVAIRWTLGGYLFLLLAYFGSKMVLELILGTHWH